MVIECWQHQPEELPPGLWSRAHHALREALEAAGLNGPMVNIQAAAACRACYRIAARFAGEGWEEVEIVILPDKAPALWQEIRKV